MQTNVVINIFYRLSFSYLKKYLTVVPCLLDSILLMKKKFHCPKRFGENFATLTRHVEHVVWRHCKFEALPFILTLLFIEIQISAVQAYEKSYHDSRTHSTTVFYEEGIDSYFSL